MNLPFRTVAEEVPTAIAALAGVGIISVGGRFLLDPAAAADGYGVTVSPAAVGAYLAIKGVRDITSGLVPLALLAAGQRRALGWALLASAFTPCSDMIIVLRNGGRPGVAYGVHGLTAATLVVVAALILGQTRPAATASAR